MAFELFSGTSTVDSGNLAFIGAIDFDELRYISSLAEKLNSDFIAQFSVYFDDIEISLSDCQAAYPSLVESMTAELNEEERNSLNRIVAVVNYALYHKHNLYGFAD
ncbi:hypothetical protein [Reinekea thalattae]|uniref:Uncharacterized protein n=1 Tax=Reinekea thalattae TaxID=2593301 RepID=A0A5C8Z8X5_9GAMM|nr:hypothetical protein [Reinekea thalattae]TXR54392.1 hypothetical protein FME95_07595 [Reinekea thalattae]